MPDSEDEKDEPRKTPAKGGTPANPEVAPSPSAPTTDLGAGDLARRALDQRYDILAELGRGGMGIVYKARDRETNEVVALKVLKPEIAARPDILERFKSELRLARKITHKNVCRTYELLRFGDIAVISMEYIEGESLRAILARFGSVPWRKGLEWSAQICSALSEAHAQGVVHRDLKPENILVDSQGNAKVMDFGIARSLDADAVATGTIVGTPAYMSPEQAEGKPGTPQSDIYSLGLVLYEMFAGRQALRAETPVALALKQIHETPPPPREVEPDLPSRIDRAIQRCLEKNPKKRFQSAAELEAALSERAETKAAQAAVEPEELPFHLSHWQRSDWLLVAAAIAGLALFFPFFNRTSIAPRSQVTFDRGALRRICEEYAQRLGAPVTGNPSMQVWWVGGPLHYVAKHAGAQAALELTNNPVPFWLWLMSWPDGTEVRVGHRGSLVTFYRHFPVTPLIERGALEAANQLAEKDLREFFGADPSLLTLETTSNPIWTGQPATSFDWLDPRDYHGLKQTYTVRVIGNQTAWLARGYSYPGPEVNVANEVGWQFLAGMALGLALLILGISQRRQVALNARWHVAFIGLATFMGIYLGLTAVHEVGGFTAVIVAVMVGIAFAFVGFFFLVAFERAIRRIWPNKLSSLVRVFDRRAISEPCGLAILRGALIGLALLGLDSFLVWLGTTHLRMWLDSALLTMDPPRSAMIGAGWSVTFVTVKEFYAGGSVALVLAFLASFLARLVRPRWLAMVLAAVLAAIFNVSLLINMGAVQPYAGKLAILFLECLLLALAFSRFDVLTILWAAFTFAFCWADYYLLVMFEPTGAFEEWMAFAVFGLFVAAAAAVTFKSSLAAAKRRLAAAFE